MRVDMRQVGSAVPHGVLALVSLLAAAASLPTYVLVLARFAQSASWQICKERALVDGY